MGSPTELTLEYCKPYMIMNSSDNSILPKSCGDHRPHEEDHTRNLKEFLCCLEEERLKIQVFKRELPLSLQLLTNAVEASRQELQVYRASDQGPIRPPLEKSIPIKHSIINTTSPQGSEKPILAHINSDMANWMTSAQLWTQAGANDDSKKQSAKIQPPKEPDVRCFDIVINPPKLELDNNNKKGINNNGGAFHSFLKEVKYSKAHHEEIKKCGENNDDNNSLKGKNPSSIVTAQAQRKSRRCWSRDLHRRFVSALQMLGGPHVATPKQIKELMKVEGLTNDEVKSHLQKYRLHKRRPGPNPQTSGAQPTQLVVLGGIWVPPEYATSEAAAMARSRAPVLYNSSHPISQLALPPPSPSPPPPYFTPPLMTQDFYITTPPHNQFPHQGSHHLHMYSNTTMETRVSPESDVKGSRDRSGSIGDSKSDQSCGLKREGDEAGGEKRDLTEQRGVGDHDQEDNGELGTVISL